MNDSSLMSKGRGGGWGLPFFSPERWAGKYEVGIPDSNGDGCVALLLMVWVWLCPLPCGGGTFLDRINGIYRIGE